MFDVRDSETGDIALIGRLDASQDQKARNFFDKVTTTRVVDFSALEYISSAGLGVLLGVQKRLLSNGNRLVLKNLNAHVRDVFAYSGFDKIFKIE